MSKTATYALIASATISGTSTSTHTFSNIPGTYTDLMIVASGTGTTDIDISCRFNGDSGGNYSRTMLYGTGSAAGSARSTNLAFVRLNYSAYWTASNTSVSVGHIMDYSNSTTFKTVLTRSNNASLAVDAQVNLWRNTAAITSIEIYTSAFAFGNGSTFKLYGIQAGNA